VTAPLRYSPAVRSALDYGRAVVALETTILAHGMPFPENVDTARELEEIVRRAGATPATIAVLGGEVCVGLDDAQLERVAREPMLKIGASDLAYAVATRSDGATTVAGTIACAALAGIAVFATGGIGGVHRDVAHSMDVSGDLDAIASHPVTVVCAGAKAILDIPKTLQALETRGVPVVGYRTQAFPAFWSRSSGIALALHCETPDEVAALVRAQRALEERGGVVVANPIPERDEIPTAEMERAIALAVAEASAAGIADKALTPWLLDRLLTLTDKRSLYANIALVRSNAQLAAEIAVALAAQTPN
jgi:pseudouridine-5'-phosphate glycosidase